MSLSEIELEYGLGNYDKAQRLLQRYLRSNPNSVEAWELARDMAQDEAAKERAEAGLRQALAATGQASIWGNQWDDDPPPANPNQRMQPAQAPASGSGGSFQMGTGASALGGASGVTDYQPYAIGVVIATVFFPLLGPVLAGVFLAQANNAEQSGQEVRNKGCLTQALIGSLVVVGLSVLGTCLIFILPFLAEF